MDAEGILQVLLRVIL